MIVYFKSTCLNEEINTCSTKGFGDTKNAPEVSSQDSEQFRMYAHKTLCG